MGGGLGETSGSPSPTEYSLPGQAQGTFQSPKSSHPAPRGYFSAFSIGLQGGDAGPDLSENK